MSYSLKSTFHTNKMVKNTYREHMNKSVKAKQEL